MGRQWSLGGGVGGGWLFLMVHHGIFPCDLGHILPRGVWCPCVRVAVKHFEDRVLPLRSGLPVTGYKHAPISFAAFSALRMESTRRDLWTTLVRFRAMLLLCHGLRWRAAR